MAHAEGSNGDNVQDPAASITYNEKTYNIVREGTAEILELQRPKDGKGKASGQSVFYNPVQQYNRDLSVLAIKVFAEDFLSMRKQWHQKKLNGQVKGKKKGQKRKTDAAKEPDSAASAGGAISGDVATQAKDADTDGGLKRRRDEDGDEGVIEGREPKRLNIGNTVVPGVQMSEGIVDKSVEPLDGHETSETGPVPATTEDPPQEPLQVPRDKDNKSNDNSQPIQNRRDPPTGPTNSAKPPAQPAFRILDALSATGLRALRYAKEIPEATTIVANDVDAAAANAIKLNIEHNKLAGKVVPNTSDAIFHMQHAASWSTGGPNYQVIDLDPYGTAAPFLDAAVRALVDGGMLCVTCTDAGVFASVGYLEKTFSQYGGLPIKGPHSHEGGLRLILHTIATTAARYGLAIEPLLSLSIDFYVRIFVRIHRSPGEVKFLASKTMVVYGCDNGCGAWSIQHLAKARGKIAKNGDTIYNFTSALAPSVDRLCEHCGFRTHQAGPMWGGPLHNKHFIQRILDMLPSLDPKVYGTIPRIEGMLTVALNEDMDDNDPSDSSCPPPSTQRPIPPADPAAQSHHPFFFFPSSLARVLHCNCPSEAQIRGALLHLGYRTTRSHAKPGSIATNAPWNVIWEIMREWVRQKAPIKEDAVRERTAGWGIMQRDRSSVGSKAKQLIRDSIEKTDAKDLDGLRKEMEAILYRMSALESIIEPEKAVETNGKSNGAENGTDIGQEDPTTASVDGSKIENQDQEKNTEERAISPSQINVGKLEVVFDERLGKEPQGKRIVRYQTNPRPDWGPMNRAKG